MPNSPFFLLPELPPPLPFVSPSLYVSTDSPRKIWSPGGIEKLTDDAVAGVEAVTASGTEFVAPVVLVGLFLCVCCSALLFLVCVWRCVNRRGARARTRPTQVVLPPLPERGPPAPFADVMYAGK